MLRLFSKSFRQLREFSAFLLLGTVAALAWANLDQHAYHTFVHHPLLSPHTLAAWAEARGLLAAFGAAYEFIAELLTHHHPEHFNFHFIVNDLFMVLFFGIAGKEVAESFLPGGALSSLKKASMPLIATLGGVLGPVAVFFALHAALGASPALTSAWAVPTATDIAYCWLFASLIFGRQHPAVTFLLVLAVLDDLIGMLIIATYYTPEVHPEWLLLVVLALVLCEGMRRLGVRHYAPYLLVGGTLCWFGLHGTGVHAALALVPVIPFMPHAGRDHGLFVEDPHAHDTMHEFEHALAPVVDVGLLAFGLANAGVVLSAGAFGGAATWLILGSLIVGKTLGVFSFTWAAQKAGLRLPERMAQPQMLVLGCVAGIGFTVALFVTTVALQTAPMATSTGEMLKLGALLSFAAGPLAWGLARALNVQRMPEPEAAGPPAREGTAVLVPGLDGAL